MRVGLILLAALAGGLWLFSRSLKRAPDFYVQATAIPPSAQETSSDRFIRQAAQLQNEARRPGEWSALFTADQINGWLAVDLEKNHPGSLPEGVSAPRVQLAPDGATVACRWEGAFGGTVASITADLFMEQPNVLQIRVRKARAGILPLPLSTLIALAVKTGRERGATIEESTIDGDPLLSVTLPQIRGDDESLVTIESVELRQDAVFVSGRTKPPGQAAPPSQ